MIKNIGFIGLGKMGLPVVQRIVAEKYQVFVYDCKKENLNKAMLKGADKCRSLEELVEKLMKPRVIMLCIPAGKAVDNIIRELKSFLAKGDIVIDLGNSFYKDTQKRAKMLEKKGIYLIDVGMSGGIDGANNGACLMIGGNKKQITKLKYLFKIMSRNGYFQYVGKSGWGHLAKGFHNLIEYGYLQSLAEGLESLYKISKAEGAPINLMEVCKIWSNGSIIESRMISDAQKAFQKYHSLEKVSGSVYGQTLEEMEKLVKIASETGVKVYSCRAAIKARHQSQENPTYSGKIINATRNIFGGHKEWKK